MDYMQWLFACRCDREVSRTGYGVSPLTSYSQQAGVQLSAGYSPGTLNAIFGMLVLGKLQILSVLIGDRGIIMSDTVPKYLMRDFFRLQ